MVSTLFPEFEFLPWKFANPPKNSGKDPEVVEQALTYLQKQLHIQFTDDWYRVSQSQLKELRLDGIFSDTRTLFESLRVHRPDLKLQSSN